ncbi:MAG: SpoIIE family protein phosphatase [Desulfobacteraceae bacterium]|nr:SpoIIE family protein phosphatase [Desulfobacteraceae bacterium]
MELKSIQKELEDLKREKKAFQAQTKLFEILVEMARSASEQEILKATMQKTLEVAADLTGAEKGSLFLVNKDGVITDSLLTRDEISSKKKSDLIGKVINKGLAGWVVSNLKVGLIKDTQTDPRWLSLPEQPYEVGSALAVPILKHKSLFGILTLMHPEPRHFDREAVKIMQITADQMALAIENAQLYIKLDKYYRLQREALERDLQLAKEVQESFLPNQVPSLKGYSFAAINEPALEVGGDLYNFFKISDKKVGIVLGDVSGKGIAAALFMARLTSDLQFYSVLYPEPKDLLTKINTLLCKRAKRGMFVTLVYILLDIEKKQILFSNGGHLSPVYCDKNGVVVLDNKESKGVPLGILPEAEFKQEKFDLKAGGTLTIYTDGVLEAKNDSKELFGFQRLLKVIEKNSQTPDILVNNITHSVNKFKGNEGGGDDLTLLSFQID